MAKRKYFVVGNGIDTFYERECEFVYYNGFSLSQKRKSIESFHHSIIQNNNFNILEISSKSPVQLGISLSAFNLKYDLNGVLLPLECVYQSAKVFELGGPYKDLLVGSPLDSKRDVRLSNSGLLIGFELNGRRFPTEPKTLFYDWLYCNAIHNHNELSKKIQEYECFTDIEYNQQRSINSQARSAAIYVGLCKSKKIEEALMNIDNFQRLSYSNNIKFKQLNIDI